MQDAQALARHLLEFIEGQSLQQLLDEVGSVPERLCRVIGARVADALAALHAADVIHRDVKPGNIVITGDETVKLMDLGIALLQEESQRQTSCTKLASSRSPASVWTTSGWNWRP